MRRIILISAAVIVLLGIGVAIYFFFFANTPTLTGSGGANLPGSGSVAGGEGTLVTTTQELGVPLPGAGTEVAPRLVRISDRPVALGAVAVYVPGQSPATTTASSTPIAAYEPDVRVEYVERESGNVYAYQAHGRTLTRLSNKTLPGAQEAAWLQDGSLAFVRFLEKSGQDERLNTYALPSNGEGGYFLEQNLAQVLTRASSTLVTLLSTTDGSSATASTVSGTNVRTLFSTPLSSIRMDFLGNNYLVTTKASAGNDGYAFQVVGSSFTRLLGPLRALSTLPSPSGTSILYSYIDRGKLALAVFDMANHTATRLPLSTLPEKCAWTSDSRTIYCGVPTGNLGTNQPDDWYQGVSSFTDRLWRIDMSNRVATLVIDPKQAGDVDIDMVGLTLDRTNDVLIFNNRQDDTLYAYDL
jgi:hypothetical protein